jgi:hypothetical protein
MQAQTSAQETSAAPTGAQAELAQALQQLDRDPSCAENWMRAGFILIEHKRWAEAAKLMQCAVQLLPDEAGLQAQAALALSQTGELEQAFALAQRALQLQPDLAQARLARLTVFSEAGYYDLALEDARALRDTSGPGGAAFALGSLTFLTGEIERGMRSLSACTDRGWDARGLSAWDGKTDPAAHLVVYGTQAYGDRLQYMRYLAAVRPRVGRLTAYVPRALARLVRHSFPDIDLAIGAEEADQHDVPMPPDVSIGLPEDAVYTTFAALPFHADENFRARGENVPYLRADDKACAEWRERLSARPRPHIGVVWAPGTWYNSNVLRTLSFDELKPLIDRAAPHMVSLQLGNEARLAAAAGLYDASPFIRDFADSAALLQELDLLISFDSGTAHLAGALGRPVWALLPFNADWRWLIGREDSIWYPSMRLFRATRPRHWADAINQVDAGLQRFLAGDRAVLAPKMRPGAPLRRHPHALSLPGLSGA